MVNKQELRKAIRARKRAITEEEIVQKSQALAEKFLASKAYKQARTNPSEQYSDIIY